jgi:predicted ATP-binding protein involved in virulence
MRLDWLRIPKYGNLRDFEIDFDETQSTTVLLGRNGSGKSNLFEAIVIIFRELEFESPPLFAYSLRYVCRNHKIEIEADPDRKNKRLDIKVDGKALSQKAFHENASVYLPNYVFAYYSGWSDRLEKQFNESTRRYYKEVLNSFTEHMPLRRLFFCRKDYSQLVLLAFFLAGTENALQLLEKYLGIKSFDMALFVMKTPWWRGSGAPNKIQREEGDPNFWFARGAFKGFLA